jgi:hypothetical protein
LLFPDRNGVISGSAPLRSSPLRVLLIPTPQLCVPRRIRVSGFCCGFRPRGSALERSPFRMFTIHQSLILAARAGNLDVMRERIAAGADISYFDEQHGSALFAAIRGHHPEAVELLLAHGVDVHMADAHGEGPLEYSLRHKDDSIITALLQSGARLKSHALPHFREGLTEHFRRRGLRDEEAIRVRAEHSTNEL